MLKRKRNIPIILVACAVILVSTLGVGVVNGNVKNLGMIDSPYMSQAVRSIIFNF